MGDTEYVKQDDWEFPFVCPDELHLKKEIDLRDRPLDEIFFTNFFPSVVGHAKLMDEYLANPRASYHLTAKNEKIKFFDPEAEDGNWIIKQCYLLLIAAVAEADIGVENLWKEGDSGGRHKYANFGRYMPKNVFKCWQSAAALMFCDKNLWFQDRRDKGWEIFSPALCSYNDKRKEWCILCMMDESMAAWKPKTSKTGGLPNITSEPRKPCDLGTQFKNIVECISGCLVFQDVVGPLELQRLKGLFFKEDNVTPSTSSLPCKTPRYAHTAEVMRQVQGAGIKPNEWVGGDTWFGSIMTAVEVMKEFGVHTTLVIKTHNKMFLMQALHSVLEARHGIRPQGHWVVMRSTISDVQLMAVAYTWSQKGVFYFISTCGSTEPSAIKYKAKFEDNWGNTNFKEINRPVLLHMAYEYLPLIDEHNKQRQALLQLEKRWLTKDPWFCLITTLVGQCVVDMHRYQRYYEIKHLGIPQSEVDALRVLKYMDLIPGNLKVWSYKQPRIAVPVNRNGNNLLERIIRRGHKNVNPTAYQKKRGLTVGNPVVLPCFVCRRYITHQGCSRTQNSSFRCVTCLMPICKKSRIGDDGGRELSCLDEHLQGDTDFFRCHSVWKRGREVTKKHQVDLHPRRSNRQQQR